VKFLIDVRELRNVLEKFAGLSGSIIIKQKKKIILEENSNGNVKSKRRNVIKIEIIE
jgi:UDP-N-acetylmuramyl pentapeptide synthase